jgi:FMN phosphatase YigB (HAD superfamily)
MPSCDIVVFDLGNVMIEILDWPASCAAAGVPWRPFPITEEVLGRIRALEGAYECGAIDDHALCAGWSAAVEGVYSPAGVRAAFLAMLGPELPGIADLVARLKAAGIRTACLSNTSGLHWPILTDPAIYPSIAALDAQHASHLFGLRKPDMEIYRAFETATGAHPDGILFFDDRPENVTAAQARGWTAVHIDPARPSVAQIEAALAGV